ncbi:uncharacterized protein LOC103724162 isoform X4 [Phoenix dactylifera]|uniref:NADH dehydrogenase [ubiquinone] 1 alpha subcomplex subunit 12 n=1 Tax=Phoenix dactylifera TaxID=42345 RepID=A0A8B8ZH22_PHODC|nr:uncharacterized protein LOC103724162 isoform X4 [Phoenix dactylifera]
MSKMLSKLRGFFSSRTLVGVDKVGNRYFTRKEEIDGATKEKRWVIFKGEEDPTSIPVEWICWLNGQRKKAPTPEEMIELEARRERVRQNVACIIINICFIIKVLKKKEEDERKSLVGGIRQCKTIRSHPFFSWILTRGLLLPAFLLFVS